jgi:maltooligosyltrehalose trehalohydrolase
MDRGLGRCASSSRTKAAYWIDEFHLDGLRLDATQQIFDASDEHILTVMGPPCAGRGGPSVHRAGGRERAAGHAADQSRSPKVDTDLTDSWNDDFHHSAMVALTGRAEA